MNNCGCEGNIKAYFKLDYRPNKLSQLQNDMDYQNINDLNDSISEHNNSEQAHSYIQELISTAELNINTTIGDLTELDTSVKTSVVDAINSEVSARSNADTGLANDYNAKIGTLSNLESSVKTDVVSAINSVISDTDTTIGDLTDLDTSVKTSIVNAINSEVSDRTSADNDLQGQIDALSAASDVTDIVGTYADLEAYDTQHLNNNDIIKVLTDETHNDAPSYYRFNKTSNSFSYIGSESASYTKAEADATFVPLTRTVNSKALSADITLSASDVGALPSTTTINDLTTTAQQNALNSGATTSNIGQIATNTSSISTINSKIPSDATSSNKLVTASTLANAIVDFSNKDLSNLSDTGNNRLHALKSYSDTGELLTDSEGLTDITTYAHSTFDESKFTVIGSPVITSDGIASGFSNSDYIYFPAPQNFDATNFEITFKKEPQKLGMILDASNDRLFIWQYAQNTFNLTIRNNSNQDVCRVTSNDTRIYNAEIVKIKFIGENSVIYADGVAVPTTYILLTGHTFDEIAQLTFSYFYLGRYPNNDYFRGYFDLKYLEIKANNIPAFSGNKTGIDTIKPDDYTVVGSPTISEDGVASGFSSSNYIKKSGTFYKGANNFKIEFDIVTPPQSSQGFSAVLANSSIRGIQFVFIPSNKNACWFLSSDGSSWDIASYGLLQNLAYNTPFKITLEKTATKYIATYYNLNNNTSQTSEITTSASINSNITDIVIGNSRDLIDNDAFNGKVDLNSFKVYVDGNLVYQPCLKIPYTLSKTGSKVVNHIYRDRVADMYNQFGNAPYYTLSDTDFTLPQGELYGMIGQQTLRKSTVSGINRSFLYSDRTLLLTGSCTSGVEVTLPTAFSNANYMLSVPYSAKTATKFTPTQTGDWFAIGEGAL